MVRRYSLSSRKYAGTNARIKIVSSPMKALVYSPEAVAKAFLDLVDYETPQDTEYSCLIKVLGCGVCGSDLLKLERALVKPNTVLGHEMVGEVFQINEALSKKYNLKKGDRIVSSHHVPCGKCNYCLNDKESICLQFKSTNFNPGAFCEYLELSEDHLKHTVIKLNKETSNLSASFTEPVACCIKAIKKSGLLSHKGSANVLILGLGSIGLIIGRLINYYREKLEINLYGCDPIETKRKLAEESGFDKVFNDIAFISDAERPDYIFLSAGANICIDLAISYIRDGGTIIVFSSVPDNAKAFTNNDIYYKELSIISSYSPNLSDLKESYQLISENKIRVSDLISHTANLSNLGETIMKARKENSIKVYLDLGDRAVIRPPQP
ncbi:MAG: alcohol dehydrogenase catalytic domain-containing protein [Cyanobacteria bacterium REEB446]|nr:alcohol dehydrogenase catalytic domain-containing protein [Cyanobacteria bacterium REEB446]